MARVVQRRSSVPYLTIAFVFTTLIAATLAVVFQLQLSDTKQENAQLTERNRQLASDTEQREAVLNDWGTAAKNERSSTTRLMQDRLSELVTLIQGTGDGSLTSVQAAAKAGKETREELGSQLGLSDLARSLGAELNTQKQQNLTASQSLAGSNEQLAARDRAFNELENTTNETLKQKNEQLASLQAKFEQLTKDYAANVEALRKESQTALEERNAELGRKDAEMQKLRQDMLLLDNKIVSLQEELGRLRPEVPVDLQAKNDGKVIRTSLDYGVVYIDLGSKDRVTIGMTFEVYSPRRGIPEEGVGKASIRVVKVQDRMSECRVTRTDKNDPILDGDLIANVAYDPARTYTFVVEGEFDIDGDGKVDEQRGISQIKDMIVAYGAKVADRVEPSVDFIVMGAEPALPPKPADTAPPASWAIYREREAELARYEKARADAAALRITPLNANRFLALMGYQPEAPR